MLCGRGPDGDKAVRYRISNIKPHNVCACTLALMVSWLACVRDRCPRETTCISSPHRIED
eukprot:scaffold7504_cov121-Isochrysis_galbana.AAC.8